MSDQEQPRNVAHELQRKFRDALDRKHAESNEDRRSRQDSRRGRVGPATNDKTKRQFRRKSG